MNKKKYWLFTKICLLCTLFYAVVGCSPADEDDTAPVVVWHKSCFYTTDTDLLPKVSATNVVFKLAASETWSSNTAGLVKKRINLQVAGNEVLTHFYLSKDGSFPYKGEDACWHRISELTDISTNRALSPSKQYNVDLLLPVQTYHGDNVLQLFLFNANKGMVFSDPIRFELNIPVDYKDTKNNPLIGVQAHLKNNKEKFINRVGSDERDPNGYDLNVANVHKEYTGKGVYVSVVDSFIQMDHRDLQTSFVGSYDWGTKDNDPAESNCEQKKAGHGTSVAGVIAAKHGNGTGGIGVAPGAVLTSSNFLESCTVYPGFLTYTGDYWVMLGLPPDLFNSSWDELPKNVLQVFEKNDIYNFSVGPVYGGKQNWENTYERFIEQKEFFDQAYARARGKRKAGQGTVRFTSSGNDFSAGGESHCVKLSITCVNASLDIREHLPGFMAIGAVELNGIKTDYSMTGSSLFAVAPVGETFASVYDGNRKVDALFLTVVTTDITGCSKGYARNAVNYFPDNSDCAYNGVFAGTSAAAPMISGVAALMLEANPDLTWREIKHILALTSRLVDADNSGVFLKIKENSGAFSFEKGTKEDHSLQIDSGWPDDPANEYPHSNWYGFGLVDAEAAVNKTKETVGQKDFFNLGETQKRFVYKDAEAKKYDKPVNRLPFTQSRKVAKINVENSGINFIEDCVFALTTKGLNLDKLMIKVTAPAMDGQQPRSNIIWTPFTRLGGDLEQMVVSSHAFYGLAADGLWEVEIVYLSSNQSGAVEKIDFDFSGH